MSYKIGRGNVAKKCLRFHATVKMVSNYQQVTYLAVAASRLTFREVHAAGIYITERPSGREAPAGVAALEAWSPMTLWRALKKRAV